MWIVAEWNKKDAIWSPCDTERFSVLEKAKDHLRKVYGCDPYNWVPGDAKVVHVSFL